MGAAVLTRDRTEAVVSTADCFAAQCMGMLPHLSGDELHEALSGAFLLFLAEISEAARE